MKTRKKRMVSISLAMVLVLSFAGCGNVIPAVNEKDSEKKTEEVTEMGGDSTSLDEIIADADEPVEQSAEADKTAEQATGPDETIAPVEAEEPAQAGEHVVTEKPAETKKPLETAQPTTSPKPTTAPAQNTTASTGSAQSSASAEPEVPANTPAPTPAATPTPEPVHEHSWKEHVATNQVWVPNIVVVDDYEDQVVSYCNYYCTNCGYETSDMSAMKEHFKAKVAAGDYSCGGFGVEEHTHTEQVKVGSHEEDQGHYDTSSYVDYYYCDCGETKN